VAGKNTLTFFLEGEFALLIIVFVLSTTTILASLLVERSASCSVLASGGRLDTKKSRSGMRCMLTFPLFLGILTVPSDQDINVMEWL
jgi:hypothetical protein